MDCAYGRVSAGMFVDFDESNHFVKRSSCDSNHKCVHGVWCAQRSAFCSQACNGAKELRLTTFSLGGTAFSSGLRACCARAQTVSVRATSVTWLPMALARHRWRAVSSTFLWPTIGIPPPIISEAARFDSSVGRADYLINML